MDERPDTWLGRRMLALRKMAPIAGLVVVPLVLWPYIVWAMLDKDAFAVDFHYAFWPAGQDVLHGRTPYPGVNSIWVNEGLAFIYPAITAVLFAVPALIPLKVAQLLFEVALIGSAIGTLWVCGVRDWRCYAALSLWAPICSALQTANLTLFLALGVALVYKHRDRVWRVAWITSLMLATKLFLWPLLVWLTATRRIRAVEATIGLVILLSLVGWLIVGFGEIDQFQRVLRRITRLEEHESYTPYALFYGYGISSGVSHALTWALGAGLLGGSVVLARRGNELRSLELTLAAAIVLSPIAWLHYLTLLLVPLSYKRPTFSGLWLLPAILWVCPPGNGNELQTILVLAVVAGLVAAPQERPLWPARRRRQTVAPAGAPV